MNTGINNRIAIGAGWMISLRWIDRLIGLVSIAILARLLLPADFGLVAYAMVFLAILNQFLMFGFEAVLIRDQDATKEGYSTVWTLEVIKGLVLSIIIVASAKPVAAFFSEPDVEGILYWVAIIPILKGLVNIGTVDFQKDLKFNKEFYFNVTVRFAGSITTVVLAVMLRSYWALVYGAVVSVMLRVILSYVMSDFRPRLCLSESSRVLGFSKWILAQNIFSGINMRLPVIVIGRYFDAQALAFFNMAGELTNLMTGQFAAPIRRALYPGITKMQDDHTAMANTVISALGVIVLLGLPATIGIGVTAPLLVPAFLGSNWINVAPIIKVLALSAAIDMFYPNSNVIFYALDRPKITALISALRLCILVPTILLVVPDYGVLGAAWVLVAVSGFVIIIDYVILFRITAVTLSHVISAVWRSTFAVIIMAVCVTFTLENPFTPAIQESTILHLVLCVASGVVSYVTAVSMLWWLSGTPEGPEAYVIRVLKSIYNRRALVGLKKREMS